MVNIGGITFELRGDSFFIDLLKERLNRFTGDLGKTDVVLEIEALSEHEAHLPPLNADEIQQLGQFISPPFIGPGVLSVPVIAPTTSGICSTKSHTAKHGFDLPLLRSVKVRRQLTAYSEHADQVAIALHLFSITIRDYHSSTAWLFYDIACRDIIKNTGPDELFRRLFVSFFPQFSSVLIHASCLIRHDRAALFLAPDEGGKSTTVQLALDNWDDCTVPGDDRILVKKEGTAFFASGYPWGRIINPSCSAKISAVFLLKKAESFKLRKLESNTLFQYLWQEHYYDRLFLTRKLKSMTFELLVDFCRQIPAYHLEFPKSYIDWDIIDKVMQGSYEA